MAMNRAYSLLELKAVDEEKRILEGWATTPSTDRMGDQVNPLGAKFTLPIPFLMQHDASPESSVGHVIEATPTKSGIKVKIKIEKDPLLPELDKAWARIKKKLVRGLSIGFSPIDPPTPIKGTHGLYFDTWSWLELSGVVIAANQDASITTIKSLDTKQRAASGASPPSVHASPGVPGITKQPAKSGFFYSRSNEMKTLKELRDLRETKAARMGELVAAFKDAGHEVTEEEKAEFDSLETECKGLETEIRIRTFEGMGEMKSVPQAKGPTIIVKTQDPEDKFKGQSYTRLLIAKAAAFCALKDGNYISPAEIAQRRWGKTHPKLVEFIKAGVAGGGTGSGEWGAELAQSDTRYTGDFVDYLYAMTVFDRLPLRSIPARVHVKGQDGAATGYWVGESKAIPVSKPDFSDVELTPLKVGAIATCSKELIADSSPSAEMLIRDAIAEASAQRVDTTFLSAAAASNGVSPAGILNGVSALVPSGADAAAIRADFQSLALPFIQAYNGTGLVHIMRPELAMAMAMLVNALGQTEFPDVEEAGGTLFKRPVYTGDNVTAGHWIVLKPSDIWKIGDSGIQVSMSDTATIEQDSAPTGAGDTPTAASATLISLWQEDMVGFKVTRRINYAKRRTGVVQYIDNAEYGGVVS